MSRDTLDSAKRAALRDWRRPSWGQLLLSRLMLMATGSAVLLAVLVGFGVWRSGNRFFSDLGNLFGQPPPQTEVRSLIVRQLRGASELTTAIFAMESVVPTRQDRTVGDFVVGSTTLLYIAYGEVRAGVDLAELQAQDVTVTGDALRLRLPPPRILDSKIDVNRSTVYDYDRGFLGLGPDTAPQLQLLAERQTLQKIVAAACSQGLLTEANQRAELVVSQLLSKSGQREVTIETQPPKPETCASPAPSASPLQQPTATPDL